MKKVALIQSQISFTPELKDKYLGDIPLLTSRNVIEIYKFIKSNAKRNCIFKYVLHLDSGILDQFIDLIYTRKQNSLSARRFLSKCTFVATISNADYVREKNIEKNTNIYFSLSPLSQILKDYKSIPRNRHMFIVSDQITPYFNQIMDVDFIFKYRVSEVTVEIINQFVNEVSGNLSLFLNDDEEIIKITNLLVQSNFVRALWTTELYNLELLRPLFNKVELVFSDSSGAGICGNTFKYTDLNKFILYENTAAVLVNSYESWDEYIRNNVISSELTNYNVSVKYDIINRLNN